MSKPWSNGEVFVGNSFLPEKRLLAAVLQRAVTDFVSGDGEAKDSAREWLFDEELTDAPLAFRFICEALDLDVDSLRHAVTDLEKNSDVVLEEAVV